MVGLASEARAFGRFCLIFFVVNFAAQSLGYLASSFSANPLVGLSIPTLLTSPMIFLPDMIYERHSVPENLRWIQDLSIVNSGFALLVINQVEQVNPQTRNFCRIYYKSASRNIPILWLTLLYSRFLTSSGNGDIVCTCHVLSRGRERQGKG